MKVAGKFLTVHTNDLEWVGGRNIIVHSPGVEVKIGAEGTDEVSERVDKFVKFLLGDIERFHINDHLHSTLVFDG